MIIGLFYIKFIRFGVGAPCVMSVDVSGRLAKGVMIKVDPRKLRHYNFSIFDVKKALEKENE